MLADYERASRVAILRDAVALVVVVVTRRLDVVAAELAIVDTRGCVLAVIKAPPPAAEW